MSQVIYKTKAECQAAINTLAAIGVPIPEWMTSQLKDFEDAEKAAQLVKNSETPIWDTLKKNYPYGTMPEEKIRCVEDSVDQLLEEGSHAEEPGLLLGKIQCGKTDTFEDIIGLAFDRGVDIAIVITKGTKALVNQTIMRMKHDYRFFKPTDDLSQPATIQIYDIMKVKSGVKQAQIESSKTVIVCKKNATNLKHLIALFSDKCPFLKAKKVLIVDDEADFASRNYRSVKPAPMSDEEGNPVAQERELTMAKISQQIDDFRKIPAFCRYLQVTATPYCLYLQPDGELNLNGNVVKPFKPRFTSLVPIHDKYIGGKEYFEDSLDPESMYSHLYHPIDQKCIDVMGHEDKRYLKSAVSSGNIYGLTYALIEFFMSTAARRIQVKEANNKSYRSSAVFHVEIDKKNHEWQKKVIVRLIEDIKAAIVDEDQSDQRILSAIQIIYNDLSESNRKGREQGLIKVELPTLEDILDEIRVIFSPTKHNFSVQPVNSDNEMDALLDEETGELKMETAANIFIGGNILDRGVTIKNMLCFFYGRDPKGFQQDTVLQHARMYGARSKEDMAVTRFHTTQRIYKILVRMNELDNQLREWFIEGKDKEEPNAIFVGFDKEIKPCAMQKIKASNALTIKKQKTVYPIGFWTGSKTAINKTVEQIDKLITTAPDYAGDDGDAFFKMDRDRAFEILKKIESTYVYDKKFYNEDRKSDIRELMCGLQYCLDKSGGKVLVLHRTNRNLNRIRENGGFMDAPMDGRTDLKPSREVAIDYPVLMLLRQNGKACKDPISGDNIGWNNAPFYWPVLLTQENINPVMYAIDQGKNGKIAALDGSDILEGINPEDVLSLTFKGDLEEAFGKEGEVVDTFETRVLKETTAARFIQRDEHNNWILNPAIPFDESNDHGLYSLNNGRFPFLVRPYKYMLLRNGRDASADMILLQLDDPATWQYETSLEFNEDGALVDRDTGAVLVHARDEITDRHLNTKVVDDSTVAQWVIVYHITKVLKLRKNTIDWEKIFGEDDEE